MNKNPYIRSVWRDHIVDIESGSIIQEGTRFTATRANNIEEGIFNAYEYLGDYQEEITKLRIQLEMLGRVPVNNGTFFDPVDEDGNTKALTLLKESAVSQNALSVGATKIILDEASDFEVGQFITIFDEENSEDKKVLGIAGNTLTVSALTKASKKGARVSRSSAEIKGNKLTYQAWGNYKIEVKEVV